MRLRESAGECGIEPEEVHRENTITKQDDPLYLTENTCTSLMDVVACIVNSMSWRFCTRTESGDQMHRARTVWTAHAKILHPRNKTSATADNEMPTWITATSHCKITKKRTKQPAVSS